MSDDLLFIRQMETVLGNLFSKDPVNFYYLNRAQKEFLNEKSLRKTPDNKTYELTFKFSKIENNSVKFI